jgi:hypothetical protein
MIAKIMGVGTKIAGRMISVVRIPFAATSTQKRPSVDDLTRQLW